MYAAWLDAQRVVRVWMWTTLALHVLHTHLPFTSAFHTSAIACSTHTSAFHIPHDRTPRIRIKPCNAPARPSPLYPRALGAIGPSL
jgi:hypothetical protein